MARAIEAEGPEQSKGIERLMDEVRAAARALPEIPSVPRPLGSGWLAALERTWDPWSAARVRSHRGALGLPIVLAKRLLLFALRPYTREAWKKQRDFNFAALRLLEELAQRLAEDPDEPPAPRGPQARRTRRPRRAGPG